MRYFPLLAVPNDIFLWKIPCCYVVDKKSNSLLYKEKVYLELQKYKFVWIDYSKL